MIIVILRQEEAEIRSNLGGELEIGMNGARNVPALARCKTQVSLHSSILGRLPVEIRASEWPCQQPSLCLQPRPARYNLQQRAEHNVRLLPVTGVSWGRQTLQLLGADDGGLGCTVPSLTDSH